MIESKKNGIWGRTYTLGQNQERRWQFICSCGGLGKKQVTLHIWEFLMEPIHLDRNKFAEHLRQCRKNERNNNNDKC